MFSRPLTVGATGCLLTVAALFFAPSPRAQSVDATPPLVTTQSPASGAAGVSTSISLVAAFSEPIQPSTLVFELRNASSVLQPGQVSYDPATRAATLDPTSELAGSQTFTATVSGARDLADNLMTPVSWSFTTATAGFQDVPLPQTGLVDPTVIQFAADGRIFVAEKSGRIYFYDDLADTTPTLFADLRTNVHNYWDRGMLGMVLHPAFPTTPFVYVLYTFDAVLPTYPPPRWGTVGATVDDCSNGATGNGCVVTGRLSRLNANEFLGKPLGSANEQVLIQDLWQQFPSHSVGSLVFGADGALYASAGDGASFGYVDYGPPSSPIGTPPAGDPANEGGALRSQDIRTPNDPTGLNGSIIRVDPDTGAALPDNPLFGSADAKARLIVGHGLRNPFRFTIKPGTNELWIGDVGWNDWEEINWLPDPLDLLVKNFGWPCYEGVGRQGGYDAANLPICETLYGQSPALSGLTAPRFTYLHSSHIVVGEACPVGSSSISGLAFHPSTGGTYPSAYNGALFFSDYTRDCIWAMRADANGQPNPADIVTIKSNPGAPTEGPVYLIAGPGGDIFYVGYDDDRLHRIVYTTGNQAPVAALQATPSAGPSPLTVAFSALGSSDPEGQPLTYTWDLDNDGAFDDATGATPQYTYVSSTPLGVTVRVRVTDNQGLSGVASVVISVNNTAPVPTITTPTTALHWRVGDVVAFSGGATDAEEGTLDASGLIWSLIMHHCPSNCHEHSITDKVGVSSGSFTAPDHEYPSYLELRLTATDAGGLQGTTSVLLNPEIVDLTFATNPAGLQLAVNAQAGTAPFTRTVIVGSTNSVSAPSPQTGTGTAYAFAAWSDGGAQNHNIVAPNQPSTFTSSFTAVPLTWLAAAWGMSEGTGTTVADSSGNNHAGTISGASWTTGKYGMGLDLDGSDVVTIGDLDLTGAFTVMGWMQMRNLYPGPCGSFVMKAWDYGLEVCQGTLYASVGNGTNWTAIVAHPLTTPDLNVWKHVAMTYDGTTLRLYVNGTLINSAAGAHSTNNNPLLFGRWSAAVEYWNGLMDEVRIYTVARTAVEIQTDMNTPISGATAVPDLTVTKTHAATFTKGQVGARYTLTVTNVGTGASSGTVTITDALPSGLTATGLNGTGWACTVATLSCTRSDALAVGAGYPAVTLTVDVATTAPSSVTNTVTASGGGDVNPANNTASDVTAITTPGSTLAAAWGMNEGTGTTVADSSGNNHAGTISGAIWTTGKYGMGLDLDGSDVVTIGDLDLTGAFTVMGWMQMRNLYPGLCGSFVMKAWDYGLEVCQGTLYASVGNGTNWTATVAHPLTTPDLNVWKHVAITYDGTTLRLYVNGTLSNSAAGAHSTNNNPLLFGRWTPASEYWNGLMDEVRIYTVARTAAEIQTDMNTPISGATAAPTVTSVTPSSGTTSGGTSVTVSGSNFVAGATVTFGGTAAPAVTVVNATTLTATTPAHAAGAVNVVVTNPDAQSGTQTNGFTYLGAAPTVTSVTPSSGTTSGGTSVTVSGSNFVAGATVTFGGTAAPAVTVVNATTLTATTPAHAAGAVNVVVTNPDAQSGTQTNGFTYLGAAPTVTSVTPSSGTTSGGTSVTVSGSNFVAGATVTFGGTAAPAVTVVNATTLTATTPAHAAGAVNVVVTNPDAQSGTQTNGFTYLGAAPTVTSVTPSSGTTSGGTSVTVSGSNFVAGATVTFGGTAAPAVTVVNATTLTATTPAHAAGAVNVVVTNPDAQSGTRTNGFTYLGAAPTVTSVTPSSGTTSGGTSVTVSGSNFVAGATVTFGGTAAPAVTVVNATTLTATTPAHAAGAVNVVVTNPDAQSGTRTNGFTYLGAAPTVTSVTPSSGTTSGGTSVTVSGSNFVAGATVTFGGTAAPAVTVVNATTLTATTPAHAAGAVNVVVTNPDAQSGTRTNGFTYLGAAPTVTSVTPSSGTSSGGTSVTVSGSNFVAGATVTFGGTAAPAVTVVNATTLTATTPAHAAGAVNVVVTNPDAQSGTQTNGFTYLGAAPTVTSVTPSSGTTSGGTSVTVSGSNFVAGATVTFGGTAAPAVTVVNATTLTATTPAHAAGAVNVVVTNPDAQSGTRTNGFTYLGAAPTVTSVTPSSGTTSGGTSVTVSGSNFVAGATVTFGGTAAPAVTVVNATTLTATTPAHAAGAVNVVVTNPDAQSGTRTNGFTYLGAAPTVTSVTPSSGTTSGGTSVTVSGSNFVAGATVTFGGTAAPAVTVVNATTLTATTPAHAAGAVNVVVTNPDAQSGTRTNGFTYLGAAPTVTSVTPSSGTTSGGTSVTVSGSNFVAGATVTFGGTAAPAVTVVNATTLTATTPAHAAGAVNVVVTNPDAQSGTQTNGFTYLGAAPTVTSVTPSSGTTSGGTSVTVSGSNFVAGATVTFGGTAAPAVTVVNATTLTATTPAHAAGAVNVVVTNPDAQSATLANGFTYGVLISFIQVNAAVPQSSPTMVSVTYPSAQTAGDLNVIIVGWKDTTSVVEAVEDSAGNVYNLAIGPTTGTGLRQSIYYASNIVGGAANTVTVRFNQGTAYPDVRILQYRGVTALDATAGASGSGNTADSGSATTVAASALIVGGSTVARRTLKAGTGFTSRIFTSPNGGVAEDRVVIAPGTYSATAGISGNSGWVMQMAIFK